MYEEYYQFERTPFSATPDPSFLYTSPAHREALAALIYGVQYRKGFIALIGEVGTGKTTVLRSYIHSKYAKNIKLIYVFNPKLEFSELLTVILREFTSEIPETEVEKADLLHRYLVAYYEKSINVVIVIDEAQNTPTDTLESMRMLSNIETTRHKMVQIILAGQPELEDLLSSHELRQLRQRLSLTVRLRPLTKEESVAYILHRIKRAGVTASLFAPEALDWIVSHAEGIPRKINMICDNALVTGFGTGANTIGIDILEEISADLRLQGIDTITKEQAIAAKSASRITSISVPDDNELAIEDRQIAGSNNANKFESAVNDESRWDRANPDSRDADRDKANLGNTKPVSSEITQQPIIDRKTAGSSEAENAVEEAEVVESLESLDSLTTSINVPSDAARVSVDVVEDQVDDDDLNATDADTRPVLLDMDGRNLHENNSPQPVNNEVDMAASLTAEYLDTDSVESHVIHPTDTELAPPSSASDSQVLILGDATISAEPESSRDREMGVSTTAAVTDSDQYGSANTKSQEREPEAQDAEHFFSQIDGLQTSLDNESASFKEPQATYIGNNRLSVSSSVRELADSDREPGKLHVPERETEHASEVDPVSYVLANPRKQSKAFRKFKKFW